MNKFSRGDRVSPGVYLVLSRFAHSIMLASAEGNLLFVVDKSIGEGPLNWVVENPYNVVSTQMLVVPQVSQSPQFDSAMPQASLSRLKKVLFLSVPLHAPEESLISLFYPLFVLPPQQALRDARFQKAIVLAEKGTFAAATRLMRGCGAGLTPSGDDFLCGWMLACHLRGDHTSVRVILKHALGKNIVSNAFLNLAAQGRVNGAMQKLLRAPSDARVRAVCKFGHSSGADLLCGLWWGLELKPEATTPAG